MIACSHCFRVAVASYVWPGREKENICREHLLKVREVARLNGIELTDVHIYTLKELDEPCKG